MLIIQRPADDIKLRRKVVSAYDILKWANNKVKRSGKESPYGEFQDDEKKQNVVYVISVARKLGCSVFLLWDDIVEVRPKMVMILVGTVMLWSLGEKAKKAAITAVVLGLHNEHDCARECFCSSFLAASHRDEEMDVEPSAFFLLNEEMDVLDLTLLSVSEMKSLPLVLIVPSEIEVDGLDASQGQHSLKRDFPILPNNDHQSASMSLLSRDRGIKQRYLEVDLISVGFRFHMDH
ncbi:hypothetical protein SELMODRAFT_424862 [Selaginella moellendorffii]|uniref:Calponin-homology (CH) domain-containing protein n=1 Tax=Selaginella moellendorffii TaxID=88036 RepID=D8SR92_SELML|nr:hypothetical protein SELMODRAFT_424862 [Selaginella moellendorffii]